MLTEKVDGLYIVLLMSGPIWFLQAKSERASTLLKLGKVADASADFDDLAVSA